MIGQLQCVRRAAKLIQSSVRVTVRRYRASPPLYTREMPTAFEQCVGNTPLLYLKSASEIARCNVYGKAEFMNPGGSIKDRAALWMIRDAEDRGELVRGEPAYVVEGTAGNTGIGLALASQLFGYETIICIARTQSQEKKNYLRWAGAKLVEVDAVPFKHPNNYVHVAARTAAELKARGRRCLYANQWDNTANPRAHIEGTGPEIWQQTNGTIDVFSCAVGTGGTLSGVGHYLRAVKPGVTIALTDPNGAALVNYFNNGALQAEGSSIAEGIGQGRVTGNLEQFKPDIGYTIDDVDMMHALWAVQQHDGLMLGLSSGINVAGAIHVARQLKLPPSATVVTVLCDLGIRYATKQYNSQFLQSYNLPPSPWSESGDPLEKDSILKEAVEKAMVKVDQ